MSLQEKLSAMKQESLASKAPEQVKIMMDATKQLIDSGITDGAIKAGESWPHFTLPDEKGNTVSSEDLLSRGPLIVSFIVASGDRTAMWELEALQEVYDEIRQHGALLVAISPQLNKYTKQVVKKHNLTFPVLADKDGEYAASLGLNFTLPEKLQELYTTFDLDLTRFNGNDSWILPMSGRFVIDTSGVIVSTEVHLDHTVRPEPSELVDIIKSLG